MTRLARSAMCTAMLLASPAVALADADMCTEQSRLIPQAAIGETRVLGPTVSANVHAGELGRPARATMVDRRKPSFADGSVKPTSPQGQLAPGSSFGDGQTLWCTTPDDPRCAPRGAPHGPEVPGRDAGVFLETTGSTVPVVGEPLTAPAIRTPPGPADGFAGLLERPPRTHRRIADRR